MANPRPTLKTTSNSPTNAPTKAAAAPAKRSAKKAQETPASRRTARLTASAAAPGDSTFGRELGNALLDTVNEFGRTKRLPSQALAENLDERLGRKK